MSRLEEELKKLRKEQGRQKELIPLYIEAPMPLRPELQENEEREEIPKVIIIQM